MSRALAASLAVFVMTFRAAASTGAATVALSRVVRAVTAAEVAAGAPAHGWVHDFFVSSSTDLLSIGRVEVTAPLYQHTLGSDVSAPSSQMLALDDALAADSYITLPGQTALVGGGFGAGPGDRVWFDTSDDGPQHNVLWARLTTAGAPGEFSGRVSVRGYDEVISLPFRFGLPSTAAEMALLSSEAPLTLEYSLDPPPAPLAPPAANEPPPLVVDLPELPPIEPFPQPAPPALPPVNSPAVDDVPPAIDLVDAPLVPPAIEPVLGVWPGTVETFPIDWTYELQLWDGTRVLTRSLTEIGAVETLLGDSAASPPTNDFAATSVGFATLFFAQASPQHVAGGVLLSGFPASGNAEAPLPEPATAVLAFTLLAGAAGVARRRGRA